MANPYTEAKKAVIAILKEARDSGWVRTSFEIKPDGTLQFEVGMTEMEQADDFLSSDLRMGK